MMNSFHGLNLANLLDSKYLLLRILVIFFWHAAVLIYLFREVPGRRHLAIVFKMMSNFWIAVHGELCDRLAQHE